MSIFFDKKGGREEGRDPRRRTFEKCIVQG